MIKIQTLDRIDNIEHVVKPTIFPDNTSQVWKLPEEIIKSLNIKITWNFENERELIDLVSLKELLNGHIHLHIPYLPYARQDKCRTNEWKQNLSSHEKNNVTFNLKVFAEIFNLCQFDLVTAVDVHNETETLKFIQNFKNIPMTEVINKLANEYDVVLFPDSGATARYSSRIGNLKQFTCTKVRDQSTGQIYKHDLEETMSYNPMLLCDFYKISHRTMYPEGTETIYSTWTPRATRLEGVTEVVNFGLQKFIKEYLISYFNKNFFNVNKKHLVNDYKRIIKATLGVENPETQHIEDLRDLGYLPLSIKALPEGTLVPLRTPVMTIQNTNPKFFWLTNFIESLASSELWQASTSATLAHEYRKLLDKYAMETVGNTDFVQFQGHDFSFRGMSSLESAVSSGLGHLLSFVGTDTIPAIQGAEHYYNSNVEKELVGTSIPATEHSIQCTYQDDMKYLETMLTKVHPNGFVSIVSDGYDFWNVIRSVLPALKDKIMSRKGGPIGDRVVIRPDSGDPVKIVCGDPSASPGSLEYKGAVEALYDIFGGTTSDKGYKLLDSHIGLIYGDSITLKRAEEICECLKNKGFASINCVYGIGSFTYQYNTRDTFGYALKSTLAVINGDEKMIFKDPKTDDGTKKSQKGAVVVLEKEGDNKKIIWQDGFGLESAENIYGGVNLLKEVFRDGKLLVDENFSTIRERLKNS